MVGPWESKLTFAQLSGGRFAIRVEGLGFGGLGFRVWGFGGLGTWIYWGIGNLDIHTVLRFRPLACVFQDPNVPMIGPLFAKKKSAL